MTNDRKKKAVLKLVNTALVYALLAMAGGVFYREFTKFNGFSGRTTLAFVHTHLFLLGMIVFLVAALFEFHAAVTEQKRFGLFFGIYNAGIAVTVVMLIVRGIAQVRALELSRAMDAAISGIAGLGHIMTGVGIILYFVMQNRNVLQQGREADGCKRSHCVLE